MHNEPHPESPASMLSVEQELLPCPFCGSDADVEHLEDGRWSAGCVDPDGDCMGFQSLQTFPRKIVAINAWNQRADLAAKDARIAALTEALKPFAREADAYSPEQNAGYVFDDDERVDQVDHLRVKHLRRAARALHQSPEEKALRAHPTAAGDAHVGGKS